MIEQSHQHYIWQLYPRAKDEHSKTWVVYTTSKEVAQKIRERKSTQELMITFPNNYSGLRYYLFHTKYAEPRTAVKSFNRILKDNSYEPLSKTSNMNEFESLTRINSGVNKKARYTNAK